MELQYFGGNCVRLTTKKASVVIDDNLSDLGLKSVIKSGEVGLFTSAHEPKDDLKLMIDQPGEYEVSDVSINGIAARSRLDSEENNLNSTLYKLIVEDIRVAVLGHITEDLSDEQLEKLGTVDVLIIPAGNSGYTLDPVGALKLIKKIEPKIVIPTHYADKGIKYPVEQVGLDEVIKGLAMEPAETTPKLKLKSGDITEVTQLIVLERQ